MVPSWLMARQSSSSISLVIGIWLSISTKWVKNMVVAIYICTNQRSMASLSSNPLNRLRILQAMWWTTRTTSASDPWIHPLHSMSMLMKSQTTNTPSRKAFWSMQVWFHLLSKRSCSCLFQNQLRPRIIFRAEMLSDWSIARVVAIYRHRLWLWMIYCLMFQIFWKGRFRGLMMACSRLNTLLEEGSSLIKRKNKKKNYC